MVSSFNEIVPSASHGLITATVEVYISTSGSDGSWTKLDGTTLIAAQEGITIQFETAVSAQYVKLHSVPLTTWVLPN